MATAQADITQIEVDNAWFSGTIFVSPIPNPASVTSGEGTGSLNLVPVSYFFTRKPGLVGGFNTSIAIRQTKRYTIVTNKFTVIEPHRTMTALQSVTKAVDRDDGTDGREDDIMGKMFRAGAWQQSDDTKYGRFELQIDLSANNGPWQRVLGHSFILSPIGLRDANLDGGSNPNGGITAGDLNNQNMNKGGFWEGIFRSVFIPKEETLRTFRDTLMQWGNWGPFGIIGALNESMRDNNVEGELDYRFYMDVPLAGNMEWDLTPYATYIKIARLLMTISIWSIVVWGMWQKVFKKV